jgi:hypothetical protein
VVIPTRSHGSVNRESAVSLSDFEAEDPRSSRLGGIKMEMPSGIFIFVSGSRIEMENRQVLQTTTKWLSESLMGVHEPPRVDPERFLL